MTTIRRLKIQLAAPFRLTQFRHTNKGKWLLRLILVFCGISLFNSQVCASSRIKVDYQIEGAHLITMESEAIQKSHTIVVNDGEIVDIYPDNQARSKAKLYKPKHRIKARGRYVLPGFADMHAHIRMEPEHAFKLFLANGVTTIRNMGLADGGYNHVELREKIQTGKLLGPRYLITGHQLNERNIKNSQDIDNTVKEHQQYGYDFMKIHGEMDDALYDELIQKSLAKGIKITGHLQRERPLSDSLNMLSVEHVEEFIYAFDFLPDDKKSELFHENYYTHLDLLQSKAYRQAIITEFKKSGVYISPTLTIYHALKDWTDEKRFAQLSADPELIYLPHNVKAEYLDKSKNPYLQADFWLSTEDLVNAEKILKLLTKELYDAQVPMILGVDAFGTVVPGFSIHQEFSLLVQSGLTPFQALKTSTVNVAEYLDEADYAGTIAIGKRADLVLLDANPIEDIANTRKVWGVMHSGKWHLSKVLLKNLKQ